MAAPVLESQSEANSNSGAATLTITKPAGTVEGDLLKYTIACGNGADAEPALLAGWTSLVGHNEQTPDNVIRVAYKWAGASEPASYALPANAASQSMGAIMQRYSGVDPTTPINVFAFDPDTTAGGEDESCPDVLTTEDDCLIVWGAAVRNGNVINFASGTPQTQSSGNGNGVRTATEIKALQGQTGTNLITVTGQPSEHTYTLALNPVVTATPNGTGGTNGTYAWTPLDSSGDSVDFTHTLTTDATVKIYEHHPTNTDGATAARHRLYLDDVLIQTVAVNQTLNGETFNLIMTESLTPGVLRVTLDDDVNGGTGSFLYADEINFEITPNVYAPVAADLPRGFITNLEDTSILIGVVDNATYEGSGAVTVDSITNVPSIVTAVRTDLNGIEQAPYTHIKVDNPSRTLGIDQVKYRLIADGQTSNEGTIDLVLVSKLLVPYLRSDLIIGKGAFFK